jgi:hypothetical protein
VRLVFGVVVLFLLVVPTASQARVFAPRPSGGGFVENTDGSWSMWGEGKTDPLRTYSAHEFEKIREYDKAMDLEIGGGQPPTDVEGVTKDAGKKIDKTVGEFREKGTYDSVAEARAGEDLVAGAEEEGTIVSWPDVLSAMGDTGGALVFGAAAGAVGVEIGNTFDRLVGLPELSLGGLFGDSKNDRCGGTHGPFCERYEESQQWSSELKLDSRAKTCKEYFALDGFEGGSSAVKCMPIQGFIDWSAEEYYSELPTPIEYDKSGWSGDTRGEDPALLKEPCSPARKWAGVACLGSSYDEGHGATYTYLWELPEHPVEAQPCPATSEAKVCYPAGGPAETGFPGAHSTGAHGGVSGSVRELAPPAPLTAPVPPSKPEVLTKSKSIIIIDKFPEELKGEPPESEEEEKPLPGPLWPELPGPEKSEVGTHYKERLEREGFTEVEIFTLPETEVDPRVGPGEVSRVEPKPGSKYDPKTKIDVVVDPETAPPGAGLPKFPGLKIGGVDEPELHLPHIELLCKKFPFGVPCWLFEELEKWTATGSAPTVGISGFEIHGKAIPGASGDFASLEPVMEKVRACELILGTIGLVLLFYRFATGGSPSGGSSSDSGGESD